MLEKHGYRTLLASDGRRGIELFKENAVDLVILDHDMPGMNGRETAEGLRHLNSNVPIIMRSGGLNISARVRRLVDACIPKGIERGFLLSTVARLASVPVRRRRPSRNDPIRSRCEAFDGGLKGGTHFP
jgi:DNA-binding response OmpR family regulator